jgi:O-methyltransferase domain/Dimerisation domain
MSQTTGEASGTPQANLMQVITGFMPARMVHLAAQLGLADQLADGPKDAMVLASNTTTHPPSLYRLLRALASLGIVDEREPGRFALTPLGAQLRTGAPGSLRNSALLYGGERTWQCWGDLLHSIRTGDTAMYHLYGEGSFEYLSTHPEGAAIFNEAMAEVTREVARAVGAAYDFAKFHQIVDVGGGNGTLIATILATAPSLRGIIFDLPAGVTEAPLQLAAAGCADRCEVIEGDFFQSVPSGADAYILKSIIHDWNDDRSIAILRNCRTAMSTASRLLLVERVMPIQMRAEHGHQRTAMMDMHMLGLLGGQERTESEYRKLFGASGFTLSRIVPLSTVSESVDSSIIEATPLE